MAIKFPDSITQNNANYITVSAIDGDVQGIYFVDTTAERDAIGDADIALDNHRALGTVVFVGTTAYVYDGTSLTDAEWTNANNWTALGAAGTTLAGLSDVDTSNLNSGDNLVYDGTNFVSSNSRLEVVVSTDSATSVDSWPVADFVGATYSYNLRGSSSRTGTVMVDYDGTTGIEITDISTNPQGTESAHPEFIAILSGGTHIALQVVFGNGYSFKAQATRI